MEVPTPYCCQFAHGGLLGKRAGKCSGRSPWIPSATSSHHTDSEVGLM